MQSPRRGRDLLRSSKSYPTRTDVAIERRSEADVCLQFRMQEEYRVAGGARVETLLHQLDLSLLEGRRSVDLARDAQEHRAGIDREPSRHVPAEPVEVEVAGR